MVKRIIDFICLTNLVKQTMTFYKAFDKDLCCRKLQYTIGETTFVEGDIKMCVNGIHCCKQALSCLQYYRRDDSRFCEVVPSGEMITEGNKTVCRSITVVRELTGEELSTLLTGPYKSWYDNGQPRIEYTYKDGRKNGLYKEWHENGQLQIEFTYKDGAKEGQYKIWHENGQLWNECTYKDGKLDGPYKKWYTNGQLWEGCSFKDDKQDGSSKEWYADGRLSEECTYKDGKLDGLYKSWNENGQLWMECSFKDGVKDGQYKSWCDNDRLEVRRM